MAAPAFDIPLHSQSSASSVPSDQVRFRVAPDERDELAYELSVPQHWSYLRDGGPALQNTLALRALGGFMDAQAPDSGRIEIGSVDVPFEISVDTWAKQTLRHHGWGLLCAEWRPGPRGAFFDVMAQRARGGSSELCRATFRAEEGRVFAVACTCPAARWEIHKESFWLAHRSFKALGGSGQARMEPWLKIVSKPPVVVFAHPASWSARALPAVSSHVSGVDVCLWDAGGLELRGYLQVRCAKSPPRTPELSALERAAASRLLRAGVTLEKDRLPLDAEHDSRADGLEGWLGGTLGTARRGAQTLSVRFGWLARSERLISFVTLAPPLSDAPLTALRCQRAFEIARASLQLGA